MQFIDKLPYGFLVLSAVYLTLVVFGFVDLENTRGYFYLSVILISFAIGYKLTEEFLIRFDVYKIFGLGIGLGLAVGIILFLLNAIKLSSFDIDKGGLQVDIPRIIAGAAIVAIEIIFVSVSLGFGSLLATLLRREREEKEGIKF